MMIVERLYTPGALFLALMVSVSGAFGSESARFSITNGTDCDASTANANIAVLAIENCSQSSADQQVISQFLARQLEQFMIDYNENLSACNPTAALKFTDPSTSANAIIQTNVNSMLVTGCDSMQRVGLDFFYDHECKNINQMLSGIPDACVGPTKFHLPNPATTHDSCLREPFTNTTIYLDMLISVTIVDPVGSCVPPSVSNNGGIEKLSAGDDVGITIGVLLIVAVVVCAALYVHSYRHNHIQRELNAVSMDLTHVEEQSMTLLFGEEALDDAAIGSRGGLSERSAQSFSRSHDSLRRSASQASDQAMRKF